MEGFLKRKFVLGWKQRWYVLTPKGLLEEYSSRDSRSPSHSIDLAHCAVESGTYASSRSNTFVIQRVNKKAILLQADSSKLKRKWVTSLRASCINDTSSGIDVNAFATASVLADESGTIIAINAALTQLLGYSDSDLVGRNVAVLATGSQRANHGDYIRNYLATGDQRMIGRPRRLLAQARDGTTVQTLLTLSQFSVADQQRFLASLVPDPAALSDSPSQLSLVELAAAPTVAATDTGIIVTANQHVCRLFGFAMHELVGQNVTVLMPPYMRDRHGSYLERYVKTGAKTLIGHPRRVIAQHKNGGPVPVLLCISELREPNKPTLLIAQLTHSPDPKISSVAAAAASSTHDDDDDEDDDDDSEDWSDIDTRSASASATAAPPSDAKISRVSSTSSSSAAAAAATTSSNSNSAFTTSQALAIPKVARPTSPSAHGGSPSSASSSSTSSASRSTPVDDERHEQKLVVGGSGGGGGGTMSEPFEHARDAMMRSVSNELQKLHLMNVTLQRELDHMRQLLEEQQQQLQQHQQLQRKDSLDSDLGLDGRISGSFEPLQSRNLASGPIGRALSLENVVVQERISSGGGSSAAIYVCSIDGWRCVMKELVLERCNDASIASFEHEIQIVERLPYHPNICRYLAHEHRGDTIRLYMTHYSATLATYLSKANVTHPFPSTTIARWLRDLVSGLRFLHERQIIHRDLKSENVFVVYNERNEIHSLAIGDFDQARHGHGATVVGTPGFIAPEVLLGDGTIAYTAAVDVYSLGMILYEIMTFQRPFAKLSLVQLSQQVMAGARPAIPEKLQSRYLDCIQLFEQMTSFKPTDRPSLEQIERGLDKIIRV